MGRFYMSGDKIPSITVQQRLFVDRWWSNGGNMIEAVEFAGYQGMPTPSDKAKRGRQLLASRAVKKYIGYLRALHKAEEDAARRREDGAGGISKTGKQAVGADGAVAAGHGLSGLNGGSGAFVGDLEGGSGCDLGAGSGVNVVDPRPGASRGYSLVELGSKASGTLLPQAVALPPSPAERYGDTSCPEEVRAFWVNIMRGNEKGMFDGRMRMRASELLARNMGMLVDMSLSATANVSNGMDVKAMTPEERAAELARLESYLTKLLPVNSEEPVIVSDPTTQ
jgi:hypothetical protein